MTGIVVKIAGSHDMVAGNISACVAVRRHSNSVAGTAVIINLIYRHPGEGGKPNAAGLIERLSAVGHAVVKKVRYLAGGKALLTYGCAGASLGRSRTAKIIAI